MTSSVAGEKRTQDPFGSFRLGWQRLTLYVAGSRFWNRAGVCAAMTIAAIGVAALAWAQEAGTEQPAASEPDAPARLTVVNVEDAARRLSQATVTLRVWPATKQLAGGLHGKPNDAAARLARTEAGVTVCSGVAVADSLVVTFLPLAGEYEYRVTFQGGEQANGNAVVTDQHSGLRLIRLTAPAAGALELAESIPNPGAPIVTAAASGPEPAVVSLGVLGASDRSIPGTLLPPMLQCDVRTTAAGNGAGVTNHQGQLIGIIAAPALAGEGNAWSYAVPARYVRKVLDAQGAEPVVIARFRPQAGLTLSAGKGEGTVVVERVTAGGPAEAAGVLVGDQVLAADGLKLRSAYQAVELILRKQPGDELRLDVNRDGTPQSLSIELSGEPEHADEPRVVKYGPRMVVRPKDRREIEVRDTAAEALVPATGRAVGDQLELLGRQIDAFEQVIHRLQDEIRLRDERQAKTDALLEQLQSEIESLREHIGETPSP